MPDDFLLKIVTDEMAKRKTAPKKKEQPEFKPYNPFSYDVPTKEQSEIPVTVDLSKRQIVPEERNVLDVQPDFKTVVSKQPLTQTQVSQVDEVFKEYDVQKKAFEEQKKAAELEEQNKFWKGFVKSSNPLNSADPDVQHFGSVLYRDVIEPEIEIINKRIKEIGQRPVTLDATSTLLEGIALPFGVLNKMIEEVPYIGQGVSEVVNMPFEMYNTIVDEAFNTELSVFGKRFKVPQNPMLDSIKDYVKNTGNLGLGIALAKGLGRVTRKFNPEYKFAKELYDNVSKSRGLREALGRELDYRNENLKNVATKEFAETNLQDVREYKNALKKELAELEADTPAEILARKKFEFERLNRELDFLADRLEAVELGRVKGSYEELAQDFRSADALTKELPSQIKALNKTVDEIQSLRAELRSLSGSQGHYTKLYNSVKGKQFVDPREQVKALVENPEHQFTPEQLNRAKEWFPEDPATKSLFDKAINNFKEQGKWDFTLEEVKSAVERLKESDAEYQQVKRRQQFDEQLVREEAQRKVWDEAVTQLIREGAKELTPELIQQKINSRGLTIKVGGETVAPSSPSPKGTTLKTKNFSADLLPDDPKIAARMDESYGVNQKNWFSRKFDSFWGKAQEFWNVSTRVFEHLPETPTNQFAKQQAVLATKSGNIAVYEALNDMYNVMKNLAGRDRELYGLKLLVDDAMHDLQTGRRLGYGFDEQTLPPYAEKITAEVEKNPLVKKAIEERSKLWDFYREQYIENFGKLGISVEKKFTNPNYFRHIITEQAKLSQLITNPDKLLSTSRDKLAAIKNRSMFRKRKGGFDYDTNFLEAEMQSLSQLIYDARIAEIEKNLKNVYDKGNEVVSYADETGMSIQQAARELGYVQYAPRSLETYYKVKTIPEYIASDALVDLLRGGKGEAIISIDDIGDALAKGKNKLGWYVEPEIAKTLNSLFDKANETAGKKFSKIAIDKPLVFWKQWQLISPRRYLKYNLRNISSDLEWTVMANPKALSRIPQAVSDLFNTLVKKKAPPPVMREFIRRGGLEATLQNIEINSTKAISEMGRIAENYIRDKTMWENFRNPLKSLNPLLWGKAYWKLAKESTNFRESILRYANYIEYTDQLKQSKGVPRNYGASYKTHVDALPSIEDKAYKLSNDLIGAYDEVTVLGQWLRRHAIPFYSFQEINMKRYWRSVKNILESPESMGTITKNVMRATGVKSIAVGMRLGWMLMKINALQAAIHAWNNEVKGDIEDDLPFEIKTKPHLNVTRDSDGKPVVFTQLGSLGDALGWVGLENWMGEAKAYMNGEMNEKDLTESIMYAPINKIMQGLLPMYKGVVEGLAGQTYYPDITKPRLIRDPQQHFFKMLALEREYNLVAGKPDKEFFSQFLSDMLAYAYDPKETAFYDALKIKDNFLESKGLLQEGKFGKFDAKSNALYNYKLSIKLKDEPLAEKFLKEYYELGGTEKDLKNALKRFDPLYGVKKEYQQEFANSLTPQQKKKIALALLYYNEVIDTSDDVKDRIKDNKPDVEPMYIPRKRRYLSPVPQFDLHEYFNQNQ